MEPSRKFVEENFFNITKWDLAAVILKVFKFLCPFRWNEIRTGGQYLAELDIGGTKFFKDMTHPYRTGGPVVFEVAFREGTVFFFAAESIQPKISNNFFEAKFRENLEDVGKAFGALDGFLDISDFHSLLSGREDVEDAAVFFNAYIQGIHPML